MRSTGWVNGWATMSSRRDSTVALLNSVTLFGIRKPVKISAQMRRNSDSCNPSWAALAAAGCYSRRVYFPQRSGAYSLSHASADSPTPMHMSTALTSLNELWKEGMGWDKDVVGGFWEELEEEEGWYNLIIFQMCMNSRRMKILKHFYGGLGRQ